MDRSVSWFVPLQIAFSRRGRTFEKAITNAPRVWLEKCFTLQMTHSINAEAVRGPLLEPERYY